MDGAEPRAAYATPTLFFDRVAVYSTTVGYGTLTLGGAVIAYQSFAVVPNNTYVRYVIVDGPQWEVGWGQVLASSQLTRGPQSSSNGNAAINCDGNQAVFLSPSSSDWALIQSGWLLDVISGADAGQTGYLTRTGNEQYSIQPIPSYGAGLTFTGGVVAMAPLTGDIISSGPGGPTAIFWTGLLQASTPLVGNEFFVIQQAGGSRVVSALNVMMNIPGYTAATVPLAGTELVPIWQSGGTRNVAASAFMLNIPGYPPATMPLVGQEQFVVYQAGANTSLSWTLLWNQILEQISAIGIPAQMVVGESIISAGNDSYVLLNNNGILANVPFVGSVAATTPPANPMPGQLWWDTGGAQLYAWSGQWVIAVNPPSSTGAFLPLTGGTLTGTLNISAGGLNVSAGAGIVTTNIDVSGNSMVNGLSQVIPVGSSIYFPPSGVAAGNFLAGNVIAGGTLCVAIYNDGTNWRQLPGTGPSGANEGGGAIVTSSGGMNFYWGPPQGDNAVVTLGLTTVMTPTELAFYGGVINVLGIAGSDAQLILTSPGVISWFTGAQASTAYYYIYNQTYNRMAMVIDDISNVTINGTLFINNPLLPGSPSATLNVLANSGECWVNLTLANVRSWLIKVENNAYYAVADNSADADRFRIDTGGTSQCGNMGPFQDDNGSVGGVGWAWYQMCTYWYNAPSDPRNKREIAPAADGALEKVNAIPVINYRTVEPPEPEKGVTGRTHEKYGQLRTGFSATDIHKIYPDAVSLHPDDQEPAAYSLTEMNALLWKAVQELSAKVEAMEARMG